MRRVSWRWRVSLPALLLLSGVNRGSASPVTLEASALLRSPDRGFAETLQSGTGDAPQVVWTAVETAGRVVEVDVRQSEVVRTFEVRGNPHNLTVARTER